MTTDELRSWLEGANKSREWLSDKLGVSKRTIDNWFTSGEIPEIARRLISRIIDEEVSTSPRFTAAQWKQIMQAMKLAGYEDFEEFITDSIIEVAKDPTKIARKK